MLQGRGGAAAERWVVHGRRPQPCGRGRGERPAPVDTPVGGVRSAMDPLSCCPGCPKTR